MAARQREQKTPIFGDPRTLAQSISVGNLSSRQPITIEVPISVIAWHEGGAFRVNLRLGFDAFAIGLWLQHDCALGQNDVYCV